MILIYLGFYYVSSANNFLCLDMDYHTSSLFIEHTLTLISKNFSGKLSEPFSIKRIIDKKQKMVLEINVQNRLDCDKIWLERNKLAEAVGRLEIAQRIILKMRGCLFGSFPSIKTNSSTDMNTIVSVINKNGHYTYGNVLKQIAKSEYPVFVTEIPQDWHWGQPLPCILTSSQVSKFSGRVAPKWHGDDVTLLYDKQDFEKQYDILMTAFHSRSNKDEPYVLVPNVEYRSYTVDKNRKSLTRETLCEYNSDFEVIWLEDIEMLVRVCYCKDRRRAY